MIKVEVKYKGKPIRINKETGEEIEYVSNYTIDEFEPDYIDDSNKSRRNYGSYSACMRKEITKILKKYQGVFSIRFYV